jgi:hypothetical protein
MGTKRNDVRFHAFMATSMKMTAFLYMAPCCLVEVDRLSEVRNASIIRAYRHITEGCHSRDTILAEKLCQKKIQRYLILK